MCHLAVRQRRHGKFDGARRAAAQPFGLLAVGHPLGGHHAYVEALDAAYGEGEHLGAGPVEPLEVVDDQQNGAGGGEVSQHFEDGDAHRETALVVDRFPAAQQGRPQSCPGRGCKGLQAALRHAREQVDEADEREPGVLLRGRTVQHRAGRPVVRGQGRQEGGHEHGLADPRGTVEEHSGTGRQLGPGGVEQLAAPGQ